MMVLMPLLLQAASPSDFADANEQFYSYRQCVAEKAASFAMKDLWREEVSTVVSVAMLACRHERTRYFDALEAANEPGQVGMADGSRAKVLLQFVNKIDGSIVEETTRQVVQIRRGKGT
jgi:hypothetical protein